MYSDPYYLGTASKALAIAYSVKKLINIEYKSFRTPWTVDPNTTGSTVNITALGQGDDYTNRQGRKIKLFSIRHQGSITLNSSATATSARFVVVRDNLGSTSQPTIANLFGSATNMLNNLSRLDDPQTNARFSILYDRWLFVNAGTAEAKKIDFYHKISSHVTYTGTASTDEGKGCIYVMSVSSESTNDPVVEVISTIKFIDN